MPGGIRVVDDEADALTGEPEDPDGLAEADRALRRVARLVVGGDPLHDLFTAVCRETAGLLDAPITAVVRHDGAAVSVVAAGGSCTHLADVAARPDARLPARMEASIDVDDGQWGALVAGWSQTGPIPPGSGYHLARLADLVGIAVANAESRLELAASRVRVIAAADEARRRIERDLHDGTQQRLVGLAIDLFAAAATVPLELAELKAQLAKTASGLAGAVSDLHDIARGIHPAILSQGGLRPALKTLARRSPVRVHHHVALDGRLPDAVEVALYYVVSEALTNVVKYAETDDVWIEIRAAGPSVLLTVRDDGVGGATLGGGSGLIGLRDRIEALGGSFGIDSPPRAGTTISVVIPSGGL